MNKEQYPQDARFNPTLLSYPSPRDDMLSLVDLAKILVRRWKLMAGVFFFIIIIALIAVMLMPKKYEYTTVYTLAEIDVQTPLETPASLLAKVSNIYLGPQTRLLQHQHKLQSLPFEVRVTNPKDTQLIILSSEAEENHEELIVQLHQGIVRALKDDQNVVLQRRYDSLQQQLMTTRKLQAQTEQSSSNRAGDLIAGYSLQIADLELKMNGLKEGKASAQAVQSLRAKGPSRSLIMMIVVVFAGMLAVMSAFVREFASKVYDGLNE